MYGEPFNERLHERKTTQVKSQKPFGCEVRDIS